MPGKTLMLGKIEGKRRRGWQRMRWLDSIRSLLQITLVDEIKHHSQNWNWMTSILTPSSLPFISNHSNDFDKPSLWFNMDVTQEYYQDKWLSASCSPSVQFSSVPQSCLTLCDPMNCSTPGLPVHHQVSEFTQTHVHRVSDAIQLSHPLSSPSLPALNPSQHQSLFQWVNSSHEVAKVLEFQL